jgi:hypothetical protein
MSEGARGSNEFIEIGAGQSAGQCAASGHPSFGTQETQRVDNRAEGLHPDHDGEPALHHQVSQDLEEVPLSQGQPVKLGAASG